MAGRRCPVTVGHLRVLAVMCAARGRRLLAVSLQPVATGLGVTYSRRATWGTTVAGWYPQRVAGAVSAQRGRLPIAAQLFPWWSVSVIAHARTVSETDVFLMLLAEALNECAEAQRRLADLKERIGDNARVYDETRAAEDPKALLRQAVEVNERIRARTLAVGAATTASRLPNGTTVTEALAQRDALDRHVALVTGAADSGGIGRYVPALDVAALRGEADRLAAQRRALHAEIQRVTWTTEFAAAV